MYKPAAWVVLALIFPWVGHAGSRFFIMEEGDGTLHIARSALSANYRPLEYRQQVKRPLASAQRRSKWRDSLADTISEVAKQFGLSRALLDAVILVESGYDPSAESIKGAVGLMQLMPTTAIELGVLDRRDPLQNIVGGASYLAFLIKEFGDTELALAAYNAGPQAVRKAGGIPNYPETIAYVRSIKAIVDEEWKP